MAHGGRDWTQVAARVAASKPLALATDVPPALTNWINGRTYAQLFEEAFGTPEVTPARIAMAIATNVARGASLSPSACAKRSRSASGSLTALATASS